MSNNILISSSYFYANKIDWSIKKFWTYSSKTVFFYSAFELLNIELKSSKLIEIFLSIKDSILWNLLGSTYILSYSHLKSSIFCVNFKASIFILLLLTLMLINTFCINLSDKITLLFIQLFKNLIESSRKIQNEFKTVGSNLSNTSLLT